MENSGYPGSGFQKGLRRRRADDPGDRIGFNVNEESYKD